MSTEFGRALSFLCGVLFACGAAAEPVTLTAADGVKVYGEAWRAPTAKAPVILAFHQAESNHSEYSTIAPRLVAAGFTVLAIDQRSGGGYFGGTNQTVAALGGARPYEGALPDMAAALVWGKEESSTLRKDVNPAGAEENWQAVLKLLAQFKAP